jgi:hypothetical protein
VGPRGRSGPSGEYCVVFAPCALKEGANVVVGEYLPQEKTEHTHREQKLGRKKEWCCTVRLLGTSSLKEEADMAFGE